MEQAGRGPSADDMPDPRKPNNLKTALIILSVALVFFLGVIAKHIWFE
jgi:hypothetical protein